MDDANGGSRRGPGLRRALLAGGAVVLVGLGVGAYLVQREVDETLAPEFTDVVYRVPDAPRLAPQAGERIFRIDPQRSKFTYAVDEKMFGRGTNRVEGTTQGIAGDLAINADNGSASRMGTIVVDVEQLHSDNNLRDARIRKEYLESAEYPLVQLEAVALDGLPDSLQPDTTYEFSIESAVTLRDKLVPLTWDATASFDDAGTLEATATVTTKMSELGIGPISIAGLVSTSDEITLTVGLVALDPSQHDIPTTIPVPEGVERSGEGPSFAQKVQPVLEASCASCHMRGEVGAKHWLLETAGDAAAISDGIGTVVEGRYMPPWPASTEGVELAHSKRLSDADVDLLLAWSRAGGPLDVDADTPIVAVEPEPGVVPRADIELVMAEPYTGTREQTNDYRCFLMDPKITEPTYLTGFAVTPDQREQVHHVQMFHTDATQAQRGRSLDGADGRPGWECFGTGSLGRPGAGQENVVIDGYRRRPQFSIQPGLIAGWVPGQDAVVFPDRSGILMMPGDQLVFQVHYHYADEPLPDQSRVSLQLDPASPDISPIDIVNPLAPVEIPCPEGTDAPLCDRSAALVEVERLYGRAGTGTANGLHVLCGTTPGELAATSRDGVTRSGCTTRVPEDGRIVAVFGHMHTLGKSFRMTLDTGATDTVLLDIPAWNFNWQMNYELREPVRVTAGQELHIECSWDRATDPNREPRYIVFAEGTEDEMCFATYAIIPDDV